MYVLVVNQLLTMLIIGVIGFIFAKVFKVTNDQSKCISKLLLYFINPCIVLNCFNKEFDAQRLKSLIFVFVVSVIIHGVMILLGILTNKERIDRIAVVFTNCGFVGIPLIRGVFGDEGVFYLMGYLAVFNLLVWTYGYYEVSGNYKFKNMLLNPNIIAVTCGIIIYCLPFTLPEIISKPVTFISDTNTAISMILVGILIADFDMAEGKKYLFRIVKVSVLRLIIAGLVNIAVLWVIYRLFPDVQNVRMLLFVVLICSMCPIATSIPGIACVFNKDASYASMLVSISSVICIVTLPSVIALAEMIIK